MATKQQVTPFHVMAILARGKQMEAQGRDVIHMEIGEPDFATPEPITQAGIRALQADHTHYTSAQGLVELRSAISQYYQQRFTVQVPSEQIFITPGASGALQLALGAVLQDKRTLMITDPGYPCNRNVAQLLGGSVLAIAVDASSEFQLNAALIEQHWHDDVAAVLVASPSNPTGTLCRRDALLEMAAYLASKNAVLIVDEIYQGLSYDVSSESVAGAADNILVLNSFSKYFGMTGWRVGWLTAPESMLETLDAIAQNTYLATSTIAQHAALAAFQSHTQTILETRRRTFHQRRDVLCQALEDIGINVPVIPQGAFYVYVDISAFSEDSFAFCHALLEEQALAITPGCDFGNNQAHKYIRLAYTIEAARIRQGVERLAGFLAAQ